jgi:hypothetical protein
MGGVPVQAGPCPVVAHGGARAGVAGGFLNVAERYPGVEGGGDDGGPQRVGADVLGSSRRPSPVPNSGPSVRSSMARSIARRNGRQARGDYAGRSGKSSAPARRSAGRPGDDEV